MSVLSMLTIAVLARAQDAELNGSVRDTSGAVLPQALVRVLNTQTGISRTTKTNEAGLYVLQSVQPGSYEVDISAAGFRKLVRTDLDLQA